MSFLASLNSVDKNPDLILENVGSIVSTSKLEQTSNHQGKISLVLQDTPPGTPGVSKNSQKYFTNKNVEFFLVNFIQNENNIKKHQMFFGFSKLLEVWSNFIEFQSSECFFRHPWGHQGRLSKADLSY